MVTYTERFIDNATFIAASSSNLFDNIAKDIHEIKSKYRHGNKKCQKWTIKDKDSEFCLDIEPLRMV